MNTAMRKHLITALMFALVCSHSLSATAGVLFTETFDGPTLPGTLAYSTGGKYTWSIDASNRLLCDYDPLLTGSSAATAITTQGFTDLNLPITYSVDVGAPVGINIGWYSVGMVFGGYQAYFHPGFVSTPGAFRVRGGYSSPGGNLSMGFIPKLGVLHHMEATTRLIGDDLGVDIVIEGLGTDNAPHTFTYSFIDDTPNIGSGTFGVRRSGEHPSTPRDIDDAMFDNFQAELVPEPTSLLLLLWGLLLSSLTLRRRRPSRSDTGE